MVEVGGVEPPSGMESAERLRAYPAFYHGVETPAVGLARLPPARLYMAAARGRSAPQQVLQNEVATAQQASAAQLATGLIRRRERNRCSQLLFFPFFNEANENPRRAIWPQLVPSKPDHPQFSGKGCEYDSKSARRMEVRTERFRHAVHAPPDAGKDCVLQRSWRRREPGGDYRPPCAGAMLEVCGVDSKNSTGPRSPDGVKAESLVK